MNFADPFGLFDVYVGCREVDNSGGLFQHCAVRVVNSDIDVTFELLNKGGTNAVGPAPGDQVHRYAGSWTKVAVLRAKSRNSSTLRSSGTHSSLPPSGTA